MVTVAMSQRDGELDVIQIVAITHAFTWLV
jgi:hypothetical protein